MKNIAFRGNGSSKVTAVLPYYRTSNDACGRSTGVSSRGTVQRRKQEASHSHFTGAWGGKGRNGETSETLLYGRLCIAPLSSRCSLQ